MNNQQALLKNPHMLWCVLGLAALQIAEIWLPAYKAQLEQTRRVVILYALAVAANTAPTPAQVNTAQRQSQPAGGTESGT